MKQFTRTLDECREAAVSLLRQYKRATDDYKTPILRDLAEVLVEARSHFLRSNGTPDWKGRTYQYRTWVSDIYFAAGFNRTESQRVQAAVRYHVGSVLREILDDETLQEYGLITKTPKERSAEGRKTRDALVAALTSSSIHGASALSLAAALNVLAKVRTEELAGADEEERAVVLGVLNSIEDIAQHLRDEVKSSS